MIMDLVIVTAVVLGFLAIAGGLAIVGMILFDAGW